MRTERDWPTLLRVSLALLVGAMAGVVARPGWATFLLALLMFGFFAASVALFLVSRKLSEGKKWVERAAGKLLDPEADAGFDAGTLRDPALRALAGELEELAGSPALKRPARAALAQLFLLEAAGQSLDTLLGLKLDRGELTYDRYRNAGLEAREQVLRGVTEAASRLKGVRPIQPGDQALVAVREEQMGKVEAVLGENRQALTQLVRVGVAVSEMRGVGSRDPERARQVVADLEELARRANLY